MRSLSWLICWVLLLTTAAFAQMARVERRQAGPYQLEIVLYEPRPTPTRPLRYTVRLIGSLPQPESTVITVKGVPGPETPAVSTRPVHLRPSTDMAGGYDGTVLLSVLGAWDLDVKIVGTAGTGTARVPIAVSAPRVIPEWLGWMIGLSPLLGLAWFALWQRRYLRQLHAEETHSSP